MNDVRLRDERLPVAPLPSGKVGTAWCILSHIKRAVTPPFASTPNLPEQVASSDLVANRAQAPIHEVRVASPAGCRTVSAWVSAGWAGGSRHEACHRDGLYPACAWRQGGWL